MASTKLFPVTYPAAAKQRIAAFGKDNITAFLRELPPKDLQEFITKRPAIDGFRKTTAQGINHHIGQFVSSLCHAADAKPRINELDWRALAAVWQIWAVRHIGDAFNQAKFSVSVTVDSDEEFLTAVFADPSAKTVGKEDFLRLMQFSPFVLTDAGNRLINLCPSKEEIQQRSALSELPSHVSQIQRQMAEHGAVLVRYKKDIKVVNDKFEELLRSVKSESDNIESVAKRLGTLEKRVDQPVSLPQSIDKQLAVDRTTLSKTISVVEKFIASTNAQLSKFAHSSAGIIEQIAALEKKLAHDAVADQTTTLEKRLSTVEADLQPLIDDFLARPEDKGETRPTAAAGISAATFTSACLVSLPQDGIQQEIKKLADLFDLLRENLMAAGMEATDAKIVGAIVTTGLATNQLVQFSGSLADYASAAVAASILQPATLGWHVPLGLSDASSAKYVLDDAAGGPDKSASIVLFGANRSAFEIYGGPIRSSIVMSQMGAASNRFNRILVASWSDGPAVYDACSPLVELGPVIDTDHLQWTSARPAKRRLGTLSEKFVTALSSALTSSQEAEDIITDVSGIMSLSTPLRKRIVSRAAIVLCELFPSDEAAVKAALLAGWLPHWLCCNRIDIDEFRGESASVLGDLPNESLFHAALSRLERKQAA